MIKITKELNQSEHHSQDVLVMIRNITKSFNKKIFNNGCHHPELDNISFDIKKGETVGLIGNSGAGKSTLGKILVRLIKPSSGQIIYNNQDIFLLKFDELRSFRKDIQMVFQNPLLSFNNMFTVEQILSQGLRNFKICKKNDEQEIINYLINLVGLDLKVKARHPFELSGGECQRVGIARSLSVEPKLIIFDEATSALDVIVQKQIINMMKQVQQKMNLTYLFISHNIGLVKAISDKIAVMHNGKIVEYGSSNNVYYRPQCTFTKQLIDSFKA